MKISHLTLVIFIILHTTVWSNQGDELSDFFDLSLEELMDVKINVSSVQELNLFNTLSTVTIINQNQIQLYNFASIAEAIRTVPGFDIYFSVLDQNIPTARGILQNFYANKVLIMINNNPTWQPVYGNGILERIDINDVDRIEVLKGPASVLYGTNAYTGVINIILKNQSHEKNNKLNGNIKYGYPKIGSAGINYNFINNDGISYFVSANAGNQTYNKYRILSKAGSKVNPNSNQDSNYFYTPQYNNYSFNMILNYKNHSLFINDFNYSHTFYGIDPSYKQGGGTFTTHEGTYINYNYKDSLKDYFFLNTNLSYDYFKRTWPDSYDRITVLTLSGERLEGDMKADYHFINNLHFEGGLNYQFLHSNGHRQLNTLLDSTTRMNMKNYSDIYEFSGFLQIDLNWKDFTVVAGSRFTQNSLDFDDLSSRVSLLYAFNPKHSLKFIAGQSFRNPNMLELYFDHPTVVGNLNLEPEKSHSLEFAHLIGNDYFYLQSLVYYAGYSHLIQRITPQSGPPSTYRNLGKFDSYGFELELKYNNPEYIDGFIAYNYMAGKGTDAETNFKFVPNHTLKAGINRKFGNAIVSFNGYICSEVNGNLAKIPSQSYLDCQLGYLHNLVDYNITVLHSLNFKNITNSDMLTPEYIRNTTNINSLSSMGYGMNIYYQVKIYHSK